MSRTDPEFSRTKDKYAGKSQRVWFLFLSDTCAQLSSQRPVAGAGTAGDSWPVIARDRPLLSRQSVHSPEELNKGEAPCSAPAEGRGYSIVCVWLQRASRARYETMEQRTESILEALLKIVWYTEHHKSPVHCELGWGRIRHFWGPGASSSRSSKLPARDLSLKMVYRSKGQVCLQTSFPRFFPLQVQECRKFYSLDAF